MSKNNRKTNSLLLEWPSFEKDARTYLAHRLSFSPPCGIYLSVTHIWVLKDILPQIYAVNNRNRGFSHCCIYSILVPEIYSKTIVMETDPWDHVTDTDAFLTLLHSERLKLYRVLYSFGLSECNRVNRVKHGLYD